MFVFLGFVLAIAGGRGPLLALALPLLILVGLGIRFTGPRILYWPAQLSVFVLFLVVATGFVVYGTATEQRLGSVERLDRLLSGELGKSAGTRAEHYADAVRLSERAPLIGHGAGSWPLLKGQPDERRYPHNLFAELLVEGGLIAVGLYLAVLAAAFRRASFARLRSDPQALCALLLFVNAFLNAMVTGDVPGNRTMFLMLGILALFAVRASKAKTREPYAAEDSPPAAQGVRGARGGIPRAGQARW